MPVFAKVKIFYKTMLGSVGSTLTATSTENEGDHHVDYIYNFFEWNNWLAETTGLSTPQKITYDAGSGNVYSADYFALHVHNLGEINATLKLMYSDAGDFTGEEIIVFTEVFTDDIPFLKEFADTGTHRYWRVEISFAGAVPPFTSIMIWGQATELNWAKSEFDPHSFVPEIMESVSMGNVLTGLHIKGMERKLNLAFPNSDNTLYDKIKSLIDDHGFKPFFILWDGATHIEDFFLMRIVPSTINNPLTLGGRYRSITLNLTGRKI